MSEDTEATAGLELGNGVVVPRHEVAFRTSRSSGPGGQNVNKVESRVTLLFDLGASAALTAAQKARLADKLASRINRDGVLSVSSRRHRTQLANRRAAEARFVELLSEALRRRKRRTATRPGRAARARRLDAKRRRSKIKEGRRKPIDG